MMDQNLKNDNNNNNNNNNEDPTNSLIDSDDSQVEEERKLLNTEKSNRTLQELQALSENTALELEHGDDLKFGEQLGTGGCGTVYLGLYQKNVVAIKILKENDNDDTSINEFKKEVQVMSKIRHPNLVLMFAYTLKPTKAIVMEYCALGDLHRLMKKKDIEMNWKRAGACIKGLITGVQALHKENIVHRDIKPLNVLVTEDWQIKVGDFGLSRFNTASQMQTLKTLKGTCLYLAPELLTNGAASAKSDIYAVGICIWEITTRVLAKQYEMPFSRNGFMHQEVIFHNVKQGQRPLQHPDLSHSWQNVLNHCWAHKPEDRWSADELVVQLQNELGWCDLM